MSDLLKEAIADAKAVRETALQNAKMALQEAFTPQIKSMLSAKLREEEKWQELNTDLAGEIESYKPYKERWEAMDARLREGALAQLPENKREKFANIETEILLNIV